MFFSPHTFLSAVSDAGPTGPASSPMSLILIPLLLISGLLLYGAIWFIKKHVMGVKSGNIKKLNFVFKILYLFGLFVAYLVLKLFSELALLDDSGIPLFIVSIIPGLLTHCVYFLPYLIANGRHHAQENAIFVLNLFAGWTIIAWIIAIVWAFSTSKSIAVLERDDQKIGELYALLQSGAISQDEFEAKKKELLDRM